MLRRKACRDTETHIIEKRKKKERDHSKVVLKESPLGTEQKDPDEARLESLVLGGADNVIQTLEDRISAVICRPTHHIRPLVLVIPCCASVPHAT